MFKPQRINELLEERRIKKVDFCEKVNISATTLNNV
nr:MAG TPA: CUT domain protein [Caudoviricetes sp.]DAZ37697.1 MAG TPA: CUT domain protein [Caudoviricetes sp.]